MGLKTTNYEIRKSGITIDEAYAQIAQIQISEDGTCYANFKIQQTRDSMSLSALDYVNFKCNIDKSLPIYEQVYVLAKESEFINWEDDIVETIIVKPITNLQQAIDDANNGDVITLTNDIHLVDELSTNKTITINLNGYNITSDKNVMYLRSDNANVTFIGEGNVRAGSGGSYVCLRAAKGVINIKDGNYSVGADENNAGNTCIYASGSGVINISGGEFSTDAAWDNKYYVLNKKDGTDSTINVTGGQFHNFNPGNNASEGTGTNFVVDGYNVTINQIDENNYIAVVA